jgi:hypothetical protein
MEKAKTKKAADLFAAFLPPIITVSNYSKIDFF